MAVMLFNIYLCLKLFVAEKNDQDCYLPEINPSRYTDSVKLEGINVLADKFHFLRFAELRVNETMLFVLKDRLSSVINLTCDKGKTFPSSVLIVVKHDRFY